MASSPTSDRAAHRVQKEYLGEISALADVLFRTKDAAARTVEDHVAPLSDPVQFPQVIIDDCMKDLDSLRLELVTPWQGVFGPIGEVALRKHMEELVPLRGLFSEFLSVAETLTVLPAMHRKVENLNLEQNSVCVGCASTSAIQRSRQRSVGFALFLQFCQQENTTPRRPFRGVFSARPL